MQVVVTEGRLKERHACDAYLKSPEWDQEQQALVYADWSATVERLLSSRKGTSFLSWLVDGCLVPMTQIEFVEARASRRGV